MPELYTRAEAATQLKMSDRTLEAERIRVSEVSRITSLSVRKVQELAIAGKLPGAAKLGGVWTFDPLRLRAWIREREDACHGNPEISISVAQHGGAASRSPAASIEAAYERLIRGKPRVGSRGGASASSGRR